MANSILSTLLSKPSFIATNEVTNEVVWADLGIVDVEIQSGSSNTDAPMANSSTTDSATYQSVLAADLEAVKIIQPSRLRITALSDNISTVQDIIATFLDETVTISINTKSIITAFLALTSLDLEQSGEMLSATRVIMTFEQAQPPANSGFVPSQSADASVYGVSIQSPPSVVPLATLTKAVSSAVNFPSIPTPGALIDSIGGLFTLDSSKL
jgi:hypothetical protein